MVARVVGKTISKTKMMVHLCGLTGLFSFIYHYSKFTKNFAPLNMGAGCLNKPPMKISSGNSLDDTDTSKEVVRFKELQYWVQDLSLNSKTGDPYFLQDCATLPFQHCCLGQGRVIRDRIDKKRALWRLVDADGSYNLANLSSLLDYFESDIYKGKPNPTCTIIFIGDSLTSDHVMAANCQLLSYGYKLESCNPKIGRLDFYGNDVDVTCKSNEYPSMRHFLLENREAKSCKKVLIGYFSPFLDKGIENRLIESVPKTGGVFVWNHGAHCNEHSEDCVRRAFSEFFLPNLSRENATKFKQWRFLFRETEPQHFAATIDGNYHASLGLECGPIQKVNNWRNEAAAAFLLEHNLTDQVKTVSIHDDLVDLWQLHAKNDCTHYVYNPYRFDVTWDRMLKAFSS